MSHEGTAQIWFDRWEGSSKAAARRKDAAPRAGATRVEPGGRYEVRNGQEKVFELPTWNAVTVTMLVGSPGQVDSEYPRYILESTDGAYRQMKRGQDDLVPGDEYLQLQFGKLLSGKRYTLRRLVSAQRAEVVFEDVPYSDVVDQARAGAAVLEGSQFAVPDGGSYKELLIERGEKSDE